MKYIIITVVFIFISGINGLFSQTFDEHIFKFKRVYDIVNTYYVDSTDEDKIIEDAIIGMLKELDPHSIYISKEELDEVNEPLQGNFEGIGIQFNILDDTLMVVATIPGGPSEKLGIKAGDRIIEIDSVNVAGIGLKNKDVIKKLRGPKGTIVQVLIKRRGVKENLEFIITRDKIPIFSVDAAYMVNKSTGYIKINRFAATTMDEFNKAALDLLSQGAQNMILDLRGNGGGYLNTSIDLADQFLPDQKMIVYTSGLKSPRSDYKATAKGLFEKGRLVILVDEGSASASEIVSGAIQDWDRGVIIGRRTFGKGLVQRPFNLPDGSMIRLTVARYYTPTGRLIQKPYEHGITDYSRDIINRYNNGELTNADSIHFPDSLKYQTLTNKRTVYGGGGIMPDIFIPLDTSFAHNDFYNKLLRKGVLYSFAVEYVDENRENISKQYPDFKTYKEKFVVTDDIINDLVAKAEEDKIEKNDEQINEAKDYIKKDLKAIIARDIWSQSEFYEIYNSDNDAFLKAVEIIQNSKAYNDILLGNKKRSY
ncbi:MAG: S41 family peptidase [Marinilabiliales bacterium]